MKTNVLYIQTSFRYTWRSTFKVYKINIFKLTTKNGIIKILNRAIMLNEQLLVILKGIKGVIKLSM